MSMSKGERIECMNYRGINMVEKIFAGILMERVHRVAEGSTDDEQRGFRSGRQ